MCGAWLFDHKVPVTLQEQVKTKKKAKHDFSSLKTEELVARQTIIRECTKSTTQLQKKMKVCGQQKYKRLLEMCIVQYEETKSVFTLQ